jgi:ubiquinone/menaquinone biosynthesis C-methylase UbiE
MSPDSLMKYTARNRFQDFYEEGSYVTLKNFLYNYRLRKKSVENTFKRETPEFILEMGSGISPVMTKTKRIIYSDLSLTALQILKRIHGEGWHVVADGNNLPFKPNVFSHAICSEVLEHVPNDEAVLNELARTTRPAGCLIVTFPHRKFYFAMDDHFVNHYRRYEMSEMRDKLIESGFKPISTKKVLGPLEKVTMCVIVFGFSILQKIGRKKSNTGNKKKMESLMLIRVFTSFFKWANRFYMGLAWLDARIMPRALCTVLLIKSTNTKYKKGL